VSVTDVVCSYYCYRSCGQETIQRFYKWAKAKRYKALRLYAIKPAVPVWNTNWGFQERDTVLLPNKKVQWGPVKRKKAPGDTIYRMTKLL
jgi:hypothetical protein